MLLALLRFLIITIPWCLYTIVTVLIFRPLVLGLFTIPMFLVILGLKLYCNRLDRIAEEKRRRALGIDRNGWVSGGAYVPRASPAPAPSSVAATAAALAANGGAGVGSGGPASTTPAATTTPGFAGLGLPRRKFASPPTAPGIPLIRTVPTVASAAGTIGSLGQSVPSAGGVNVATPSTSSTKRRRMDEDEEEGTSSHGGEPGKQIWKRTRQGIGMATNAVFSVIEAGKRKLGEADEGRKKRRRDEDEESSSADGSDASRKTQKARTASSSSRGSKRPASPTDGNGDATEKGEASTSLSQDGKGEGTAGASKKSKRRRQSGAVRRVSFGGVSPETRYYDTKASASKVAKGDEDAPAPAKTAASASAPSSESANGDTNVGQRQPLPTTTPLSVRVGKRKVAASVDGAALSTDQSPNSTQESKRSRVDVQQQRRGRIALKTGGHPYRGRAAATVEDSSVTRSAIGGLFVPQSRPADDTARRLQEERILKDLNTKPTPKKKKEESKPVPVPVPAPVAATPAPSTSSTPAPAAPSFSFGATSTSTTPAPAASTGADTKHSTQAPAAPSFSFVANSASTTPAPAPASASSVYGRGSIKRIHVRKEARDSRSGRCRLHFRSGYA